MTKPGTKLCQLATEDGEYAVEIAAFGALGLLARAKKRGGTWSDWWAENIGFALSKLNQPPRSEVILELSEKAMAHPDLDLSDAVPKPYRTN